MYLCLIRLHPGSVTVQERETNIYLRPVSIYWLVPYHIVSGSKVSITTSRLHDIGCIYRRRGQRSRLQVPK
jgi:hypothetical protein